MVRSTPTCGTVVREIGLGSFWAIIAGNARQAGALSGLVVVKTRFANLRQRTKVNLFYFLFASRECMCYETCQLHEAGLRS